jgi:hypothetical protein
MRALKIIGITIISVLGLLVIVALLTPKQYTVSTSLVINKPQAEVMEYMKMLKNQKEYSEWVKADPNNEPEIVGVDGTVGAIQKWDSPNENVGKGEQQITALTESRMDVDLRFEKPFKAEAKAADITEKVSETETKLTTEFYANDKFPFNLMGYYMGRPMIEETMNKNLQNIKTILESK